MRVRHLQSHLADEQLIHAGGVESLRGFRIGIDAVYWLRSIQSLKDPLADALGGVPPGTFAFIDAELEAFRRCSITPVFVFQGMAPGPHDSMFVSRIDQQMDIAWAHLAEGDKGEAQKCFAMFSSRINSDFVFFIFHHLKHKGCEVLRAPYLAGAQLSHFAANGVVHSVIGPPGLLLYDVPRVIIGVDFEQATFDWVDLQVVLDKWQLSRDQFIDACMLAGTECCRTYPYLNLGHFQPAARALRFNFDAAVSTVKRAPLASWMQIFPTEAMKRDHLESYCTCKVIIQSSPILHVEDRVVRPRSSTLPDTPPHEVPKDFSEIVGERLPVSLYFLMLHGVVSHKLPQALAKGEWVDKSQPLVDTREFRDLVMDLQDYRQRALGLLVRHLHPSFAQKDIVCKAVWERSGPRLQQLPPQSTSSNPSSEDPVLPRTIRPKLTKRGLRWRVDQESVRREMQRQGVSKVDFKFCLMWHSYEVDMQGPLYRDLTKFGEPSLSDDENCLATLVHFMLLEQLELIAENGDMTVLGNVLKGISLQFQEPGLIALEMMKFGVLNGEPFDAAQALRPFPEQVHYPQVPVDAETKSALLLSRVVSLVPMRLKADVWNSDVDFDLAAFHSLVRVLQRSLRQLMEACLTSVLMRDMERVKLLPRGYLCGSPSSSDPAAPPAAIFPTFMLPRACMGIVMLRFLRWRGNNLKAFEREVQASFPCCVRPIEDLRSAFVFWEELSSCVDQIAEPLGAEELAQDMHIASEVLHAKQQQLGLLPSMVGGGRPSGGGGRHPGDEGGGGSAGSGGRGGGRGRGGGKGSFRQPNRQQEKGEKGAGRWGPGRGGCGGRDGGFGGGGRHGGGRYGGVA